jgi:hypothetical protein
MLEWLYNLVVSFVTWVLSFFGGSFNKMSGGEQEEQKGNQTQYSESSTELSPLVNQSSSTPVLLP